MSSSRIPGIELTPLHRHTDKRGGFVEVARSSHHHTPLVQANHSQSKAGVLRGLHYHRRQSDLWYVVAGRAQAGLVDLRDRRGESLVCETLILDGETPASLYIPPGIAHGFLALTDLHLVYWVTHEYDGSDEYGVAYDDPRLALEWSITNPIVSERDATNPELSWADIPEFS